MQFQVLHHCLYNIFQIIKWPVRGTNYTSDEGENGKLSITTATAGDRNPKPSGKCNGLRPGL